MLSTLKFLTIYFMFEVSNLHILWLRKLQPLATYATTGAMPLNQ